MGKSVTGRRVVRGTSNRLQQYKRDLERSQADARTPSSRPRHSGNGPERTEGEYSDISSPIGREAAAAVGREPQERMLERERGADSSEETGLEQIASSSEMRSRIGNDRGHVNGESEDRGLKRVHQMPPRITSSGGEVIGEPSSAHGKRRRLSGSDRQRVTESPERERGQGRLGEGGPSRPEGHISSRSRGNESFPTSGHRSEGLRLIRTGFAEQPVPAQNVARAGSPGSLRMFQTSSTALSSLFKSFRDDVVKELVANHRTELKVTGDLSSQCDRIQEELKEVHGLLQLRNQQSGGNGVEKTMRTALSAWDKKLNDLTPLVKEVFNSEVMSRVLAFNTPVLVCAIYEETGTGPLENASVALQTMLFSLQPTEPRTRYDDGIGKRHSTFKYAVVQNMYYNIKVDSFKLFRQVPPPPVNQGSPVAGGAVHEQGGPGGENAAVQVSRPAWLSPNLIKKEHIARARNYVEKSRQSRRKGIRDTPTPVDVATHGALLVYRQLGGHLYQARENVKYAFFQMLGYLTVPWLVVSSELTQGSMTLDWASDTSTDPVLLLEEIPLTRVASFSSSQEDSIAADAHNKGMLNTLFQEWPDMVLHTTHDVMVVERNGPNRRRAQAEQKVLTRSINIIEVAAQLCVEFCRCGSVEIFMRTNKSALQCVMVVANVIRKLIAVFITEFRSEGVLPEASAISVGGLKIGDLLPGAHTRKTLLETKCLRLSHADFAAVNCPSESGDSSSQDEADMDGESGEDIEESMEMGIGGV